MVSDLEVTNAKRTHETLLLLNIKVWRPELLLRTRGLFNDDFYSYIGYVASNGRMNVNDELERM
jgi:hypothetical protein